MKTSLQLLIMLSAAWVWPCAAQSYPTKPIEMISPTGAGGGSDLVARAVADIIGKEKMLSQPIVVQNRAGGGRAVGQTYAAAKRGDPYIILVAGTSVITVPLRTGLDVGLDKFQKSFTVRYGESSRTASEFRSNAEEFTRWLVAQQTELTRFLTEMGLAVKKDEKK